MSRTAVQALDVPATAHQVVWFAPDRPVEGNTVYVLPGAGSDVPTGYDESNYPDES